MAQTSEHVTSTVPAGTTAFKDRRDPTLPSAIGRSRRPAPWVFGVLLGLFVVVTGLVVWIAITLALSSRTVEDRSQQPIAIPYAKAPGLWGPFQSWVVQEDGRKKPFQTFCIESVRTITGRERFEHNDPVPVVVSWMMLSDLGKQDPGTAGKKMSCDWEHHPFILCDYHELRKELFEEIHRKNHDATEPLTEEEKHGKYVSPAQLRGSERVQEIIDNASRKLQENPKADLDPKESKAREVASRLDLYDVIRKGGGVEVPGNPHRTGEFQVVALDRAADAWFSLESLSLYTNPPTPPYAPDQRLTPDEVWDRVIHGRSQGNEEQYEQKQPIPLAGMKEVLTTYHDMQEAYRSNNEESFQKASTTFLDTVNRVSNEQIPYPAANEIGFELWYNRVNPFQKAWIVSMLATLLLGASMVVSTRWMKVSHILYGVGLAAYLGALLFAVVGFYCRCKIAGRPPVSNMYESIIFVGTMTSVFGLILELVYRKGVIAVAGSAVSTLCLVLADQLPLTFSPGIQPINAVLRSNYWLIIHVMTIVSSYAALALAWGLGNFNLSLIVFAPGRRDLIKTLSMFGYRAIQIGVILLFLGTMLGGFWAAESWGRFWGWDPKEVWALIAFLCYIIPLHMRYVGWVKDFGLAAFSVCCFAAVVMAWYGVNFVLKAGLHSYGFGAGGNWNVYLAGLVNIDLVLLAAMRYLYRDGAPVSEPIEA